MLWLPVEMVIKSTRSRCSHRLTACSDCWLIELLTASNSQVSSVSHWFSFRLFIRETPAWTGNLWTAGDSSLVWRPMTTLGSLLHLHKLCRPAYLILVFQLILYPRQPALGVLNYMRRHNLLVTTYYFALLCLWGIYWNYAHVDELRTYNRL